MDDDNGHETSPLLAPTAKARNAFKSIQNHGRGLIVNRVGIVIVLALLAAYGVFSERQINTLQVQLDSATTKITTLEDLTKRHEGVIQRFNSSVTNTDVLGKLKILEKNLNFTVTDLHEKLLSTQQEIQNELVKTKSELSDSVHNAETEITNQVDRVKKEFDQYVVTTEHQFSMENSFMVYQLAGTFTLLSCLISMWHMTAHLRKLNQPDVQRKILAILWMSPIYAITSWFSLVFHEAEGYLAIIKDGYEAYIIYQFLSFCIAVLGKGDRNAVVDLLALHADHLTPPFRLLGCFEVICGCCPGPKYENNRQLADDILLQCQLFAMQFVFFRPLTTTAMVVLGKLQYYGPFADGPTDYRAPQFYITIIQNISIFVAFTGLLKFYHAVDQDLAWCRPFAKFLCIKGVVFMTFWQGLAISILAETTDVGGADAEEWAKSAQNFLICLEMLLFSIAHFYCFPTDEWEEGYRVKHSRGNFGDSIALGDFFSDLKLLLKSNGKKKRHSSKNKLTEIPEGDQETDDDEDEEDNADDDDDDNNDEGNDLESSNDSTANTAEDEEHAVMEALHKSLGDMSDDPDIAEATKRLLDSKVLSPEFFSYSQDEIGLDDADDDDAFLEEARRQLLGSVEEVKEKDDKEVYSEDYLTKSKQSEVGHDNYLEDGAAEGEDDDSPVTPRVIISQNDAVEHPTNQDDRGYQAPTERSRLLSPSADEDEGTSFEEVLRPSIFTTVASIEKIQKQAGESEHKSEGDDDQYQDA